jgi:serine/threonine protein kinase
MVDVIPVEPAANCCPVCGAQLPSHAPQGLCPLCVLQGVLSDSDPVAPEEQANTPITGPYLPSIPTAADLAPHFPELEILELLGQGGMGAVYKARQRKLDRLVALKILPPEWGGDPAFAERFAREARALARLNHPQVVAVHDFGEVGGHYFLIMEFVDGGSLRQYLTAGPLQPWQALPIVGQICDALQYAHEQGVVHRDIKPENILLDQRGHVKIADFGLAKLLRRSRSEFTLTTAGQVMGTLDYMAPEQRTSPQAVDHRADIYSLGVVFYEMLTGELPLGRFAPPSQKASVDDRLDDVIFRTLEREPDRRYQRISAVKADVESILRTEARTILTPRRRPVRSFFLSMFSMFAPRSMLGRRAATDRAAPRRQQASPGRVPLPPRQAEGPIDVLPADPVSAGPARLPSRKGGKRKKLLWAIPVAAGLLVPFVVGLWNGGGGGSSPHVVPRRQQAQPEGLVLGDLNELKITLGLSDNQFDHFKRILAGADKEYLELEQRHTSRTVTWAGGKFPQEHLVVTISPFPEEATDLQNRVWAKLESTLPFVVYNARKQLPKTLFAFGQEETKIEIWQEGIWFYWKVMRSAPTPEQGNGKELPPCYQRFWQGGPR